MRRAILLLSALIAASTASAAPKTIRIKVSADNDAPVSARVWINRSGDQWRPFADTNADGLLIREFICADGIMFKAKPASRRYYESNDAFCNTQIVLRVSTKSNPSITQNGHQPMVGSAAMYPTKTIVANAVNSKDLTTLVAAVKAAGLVDTLSGPGPFTVFAPTNAAFASLPAGTVDTLVKPENKSSLTSILTYHVIPGRITIANIAARAKVEGGTASYTTVEGQLLMFRRDAKGWAIIDARGETARITIENVLQANGVIHVIDQVLMP